MLQQQSLLSASKCHILHDQFLLEIIRLPEHRHLLLIFKIFSFLITSAAIKDVIQPFMELVQ